MRHLIVVQPFNCPVTVCTDRESYCDHFPVTMEGIAGADGLCQEFVDKNGNTGFGLLILKKYDEDIVHHETLHLVHMVMEAHGVTVNGTIASSEVQCYLQTHIVEEIKEVCYGKKRKKHKS